MSRAEKLSPKILRSLTKAACDAALAGAKISVRHFEKVPPVETKSDRSPVTKADRETELAIRKVLRQRFKDHEIVGEEFGVDERTQSEFRWWIDPIDGTMQFIRQIPFWGSVIGVEYQGEVVAGSLHLPLINWTIWAGKGLGCYGNGKALQVSKIQRLRQATVVPGGLFRAKGKDRTHTMQWLESAYDHRGSFDVFSHALVISGRVDAMVDFGIKPYDVSAVKICVEEAGGVYTDLKGKKNIHSGHSLVTNRRLHKECLSFF